jgi:hypothetical protein
MKSNAWYLVLGLILGSALTIAAAFLAGPTVNVTSSVQDSGAKGRYELETRTTADGTTYAVFDRETGEVREYSGERPLQVAVVNGP